jgi:hypothetical protein
MPNRQESVIRAETIEVLDAVELGVLALAEIFTRPQWARHSMRGAPRT